MKTYVTVHAVVVNEKNEYLILQRADHRSDPGKWNCVTGFIQERECAEEGALRELKEETNLTGEIIKTTEPFWVDSDEVRWVVIPSLIKVKDLTGMKIDENESQDFKWIKPDDPLIVQLKSLRIDLVKLGILSK